jgi:hypothetical protein
MRKPYLVVIDNEKSFVHTDSRKIKRMFIDNKNIEIYTFKIINTCSHMIVTKIELQLTSILPDMSAPGGTESWQF